MKARLWGPLVAALLVVVGALVVVLSDTERRLAGTNNVRPVAFLANIPPDVALCQRGEVLPADAAGVRVLLGTFGRVTGDVGVAVRDAGGELVADGRAPAANAATTISVSNAGRDVGPVTVCLRNLGVGPVAVAGNQNRSAGTRIGSRDVKGTVALEYVREGSESWWALAPTVARRFGLAKAGWVAGWTFWAAIAGMAALWAAAIGLTVRTFRVDRSRSARVASAAVACCAVAVLNGVLWSVLVPPFHVPDETAHVGYAQHVAEEGRPPPQRRGPEFAPEETSAIEETAFPGVVGNRRGRPLWNDVSAAPLDVEPVGGAVRVGGGGANSASNNPVAYYALQAAPYWLASGGSLLDRIALMRLVSALLAGLTVLGVFLFVREVLPGSPWAWTVGALGVALQPTFAFIAGGVNNDNLLFAAAAWLFYLLARAFRGGLSPSLGVAIGLVTAGGLLAKLTMLALVPAAGLAILLLVLRSGPSGRREAVRGAGLAALCLATPLLLYAALSTVVWDRALFSSAGGTATREATASLTGRLSYEWQFYLPPLPFMTDLQPGYPLYDVWFHNFIGRFGWLDYDFPSWVYSVALGASAVLTALVISALVSSRAALRRRALELAVYLTAVIGLITLVAFAGYQYRLDTGFSFEQARYLLPLLALYGALLALAVLGAPVRWRPGVAAVIVVLALAHNLFSQLLTLSRYYG